MELIIKLYQDKPSRIGILYGSEYAAGKAYADIPAKYKGEKFRARLEVVKDRMNLILISDQSTGRIEYKNLEYKSDQLKKLQIFVKPDAELEFVHIYPVENKLLIARPNINKKMEFIFIKQYEVLVNGEYFPIQ